MQRSLLRVLIELQITVKSCVRKILKEFRERANLTQDQLGEKIGLTGKTVSYYEGLTSPSVEILEKVAPHLGTTVDELQRLLLEPIRDSQDKPSLILELFPDEQLHRLQDFLVLASRSETPAETQDKILTSMRAIVEEQQRRIGKPWPSSMRLSEDVVKAFSHAASAQKLAQESEPKQKAAAPNADKPEPGGGAGKGKK